MEPVRQKIRSPSICTRSFLNRLAVGRTTGDQRRQDRPHFSSSPRRALLLGTALATAFAFAHPAPAAAQQAVFIPFSFTPVNVTNTDNCIFIGSCAFINTIGPGASIDFTNTGDFAVIGIGSAGIFTNTTLGGRIAIDNSGDIATAGAGAIGISASTLLGGNISIENSGNLATAGFGAIGISAVSFGNNSDIEITNTGDIATLGFGAYGIYGYTSGRRSDIDITNDADIRTRGVTAHGISAISTGRNGDISITNDGDIDTRGAETFGINAIAVMRNSGISISNSGDITNRGLLGYGINAVSISRNSAVTIENTGSVRAEGAYGFGVLARSIGNSSPIEINNSGELYGSTVGIDTYSRTSTTIYNSGDISAGTGLAINTDGARTKIDNSGLITGFVDLTRRNDTFRNLSGGEFNASDRSRFRRGDDVFINQAGAVLRTADNFNESENTRFTGLDRFENSGLITMVDGRTGDQFTISNSRRAGTAFKGSGSSTLAVDSFLGGPGSTSDTLVIEGDISGRTRLSVNNVNSGPGALNRQGIPVAFIDGNVNARNLFLEEPIDTGFFDYDLFFVPTGSGRFELRSHVGGGAQILPQLVTTSHQTFHNSAETWFDRSTDLRALLARGSVCKEGARSEELVRCQELYDTAPGVWVRGAGSWFDLEDNATTRSDGRTYRFDLGRDLTTWQIESGIDFGQEAVFAPDDILVFGVLGGAVEARLDYDALSRSYDFSNLEVGAYATYLRGGFFVDTLFKAFFGTLEPDGLIEFSETLDTQTYGLRFDSGYRFGGVRNGPFLEPLGTIAVSWTHIDDFSNRGNSVDFDDDEEVRGRVGLRAGTNMQVWESTTFEPFLVGSLWGVLSDEHNASLTSTNTQFFFSDDQDDVWGEISGGVNFFNPEAQTAVFAKVDYIFADETEGVRGRAGMRINW